MSEREQPYLDHLASADDLVTRDVDTRAWFAGLALEKTRQAAPLVNEARSLQHAARGAASPWDLLDIGAIQSGLLTAAGLSAKAQHHVQPGDKTEVISGLIRDYLEPAGEGFVEELVFRFLLTRGDELDGAMRSVGGALAQRKMIRAIISGLSVAGLPYRWRTRAAGWIDMSDDDVEIERSLRGLTWGAGDRSRTLLVDLNVPIVGATVDICLFGGSPQAVVNSGYAEPGLFLAVGELKGGIDPTGTDDHSKTASANIARIHAAFVEAGQVPLTFFVGAAIDSRIAFEIWEQLQTGRLANAANLNRHEQLNAVSRWLCML